MRLRHSVVDGPGLRRVRRGRGFGYRDEDGVAIADSTTLQRIEDLVIPPAWRKVWICPHPNGHIQAVGTDAAGRRQYIYHSQWQEDRSEAKLTGCLSCQRCSLSGVPASRAIPPPRAVPRSVLGTGLTTAGPRVLPPVAIGTPRRTTSIRIATSLRRPHHHAFDDGSSSTIRPRASVRRTTAGGRPGGGACCPVPPAEPEQSAIAG